MAADYEMLIAQIKSLANASCNALPVMANASSLLFYGLSGFVCSCLSDMSCSCLPDMSCSCLSNTSVCHSRTSPVCHSRTSPVCHSRTYKAGKSVEKLDICKNIF